MLNPTIPYQGPGQGCSPPRSCFVLVLLVRMLATWTTDVLDVYYYPVQNFIPPPVKLMLAAAVYLLWRDWSQVNSW